MPVMLTTPANFDAWLSVETEEALNLQRPLPVEKMKIVAKGDR
jgi:putative SOS response-associated peptidase YedK